jgi:hypothetical protein
MLLATYQALRPYPNGRKSSPTVVISFRGCSRFEGSGTKRNGLNTSGSEWITGSAWIGETGPWISVPFGIWTPFENVKSSTARRWIETRRRKRTSMVEIEYTKRRKGLTSCERCYSLRLTDETIQFVQTVNRLLTPTRFAYYFDDFFT